MTTPNAELIELLRQYADSLGHAGEHCHISDAILTACDALAASEARVALADKETETERMRLVACGVVAHGGTAAGCHPDYRSDALDAVERLAARVAELKRVEAALITIIRNVHGHLLDDRIDAARSAP